MTTMSPLVELLLQEAMAAAENAAVYQRLLDAKRRVNLLAYACQYDLPNVEFCRQLAQASSVPFLDILDASYGEPPIPPAPQG
jgi:hypothetical protein